VGANSLRQRGKQHCNGRIKKSPLGQKKKEKSGRHVSESQRNIHIVSLGWETKLGFEKKRKLSVLLMRGTDFFFHKAWGGPGGGKNGNKWEHGWQGKRQQ